LKSVAVLREKALRWRDGSAKKFYTSLAEELEKVVKGAASSIREQNTKLLAMMAPSKSCFDDFDKRIEKLRTSAPDEKDFVAQLERQKQISCSPDMKRVGQAAAALFELIMYTVSYGNPRESLWENGIVEYTLKKNGLLYDLDYDKSCSQFVSARPEGFIEIFGVTYDRLVRSADSVALMFDGPNGQGKLKVSCKNISMFFKNARLKRSAGYDREKHLLEVLWHAGTYRYDDFMQYEGKYSAFSDADKTWAALH